MRKPRTKKIKRAIQGIMKTAEEQQAQALSSMLAQAVLNQISALAGTVINEFDTVLDLINQKTVHTYANGVDFSSHRLATIEQFNKSLKPCIDDEAKTLQWKDTHFCELKISRGGEETPGIFSLVIMGVNANDEQVSAIIPPVKIMEYANG